MKSINDIAKQNWLLMKEARGNGEKKLFEDMLLPVVMEIKRYFSRRLKALVLNGRLPKRKYNVNDFLDALYLKAYNHFNNFNDSHEFVIWLFKEADILIDEAIERESFIKNNFDDVEAIEQAENAEMEENYSVGADGDLRMMEDFDDPSYRINEFELDRTLIDDEEENKLVEKLNNELSESEINKYVDDSLFQLKEEEQITIELASLHGFSRDDISIIRNMEANRVSELIKMAQSKIIKSVVNKFNS